MQPLLKVQGLHKHFKVRANLFVSKQLNALSDVSFCLGEAETLAVIGETGSGKSTLGKILAGADNANRGQILLNNDIIEDNGKRITNTKAIRLIFQDTPRQRRLLSYRIQRLCTRVPSVQILETCRFWGLQHRFRSWWPTDSGRLQ